MNRLGGPLRRGFTLIEAMLSVVIVGTGVLGAMQLFANCTAQNREATHMSAAMFLANNVQELMAELPFSDPSGTGTGREEAGQPISVWDDLDDFNGHSAQPPLDANREPIAGMADFRQVISVASVDPNGPSLNAAGTDAARVTVRVFYRPLRRPDLGETELHRISWVRLRK